MVVYLCDSCMYNTIIPIPKNRNVSTSDSANYRGIALSSIYGKLFDNIVLHHFSKSLSTNELQFGFKAKNSTNHCTFVLKESLAYYVENQSAVYCAFLDATKAFEVLTELITASCLGFYSDVIFQHVTSECC